MDLLQIAVELAKKDMFFQRKDFLFGAVGIRSDGVLVRARNERTEIPCIHAHAEFRLASRLTSGATVAVARVTRDGMTAMAKPCPRCENILRHFHVRKVYYTTGPGMMYGVMKFN